MRKTIIDLLPVPGHGLIYIYDDGESTIDLGDGRKLVSGLNDTRFDNPDRNSVDTKHPGLRSRWAILVSVNDMDNIYDVRIGDKVLCEELRWTRGFIIGHNGARVWRIPLENIIAVDQNPFTKEEADKINKWYEDIGVSNVERWVEEEGDV